MRRTSGCHGNLISTKVSPRFVEKAREDRGNKLLAGEFAIHRARGRKGGGAKVRGGTDALQLT